ncbi:MAG TPA: VOC family protein [Longimicrobiaceae bacterium]|nr:VOC family protein [Longimicrobiaceae bacterium]
MTTHTTDRTDAPYGVAPTGYRLPAEARPGRVRLQVADLDRSLAYYEGVLGFRVLRRGEGHAALGAHGDERTLVELHERKGAAPVPRRGALGLYHFAILLPDRAALGRFLVHLAQLGARAGSADHLVSEAIYLQDPDGLGIEVYADRPRSEWRHRDGELAMATEPLDAGDLARAAGGEPWTGMPAGTVVGHVHLHVGDLAGAEAFYHRGLGLDKVVWSYPGALFLSAGGYHHHLGVNTWAAGAPPAGEGDARLLDWELLVPDADEARSVLRSLAAAGYAAEHEEQDDGGVVRDPWGTALRVRPERTSEGE